MWGIYKKLFKCQYIVIILIVKLTEYDQDFDVAIVLYLGRSGFTNLMPQYASEESLWIDAT